MMAIAKESAHKRTEVKKSYEEAGKLLQERKFKRIQEFLAGLNESVAELAEIERVGLANREATYSVVIVSYCPSRDLEIALQSVDADARSAGSAEIVLVDNGNPDLYGIAKRTFSDFTYVRAPFQIGCSAGRNLGARVASGPHVIFLDDDGLVSPGCLNALIRVLKETPAVAVRGRVRPKTSGKIPPKHYDLGDSRIPALITCEGVSAWRRQEFLEYGGFDPILAGHEGVELCARMFRFVGPLGFAYEPSAVLLHDPSDGVKAVDKAGRYAINKEYVELKTPETYLVVEQFREYLSNPKDRYLAREGLRLAAQSTAHQPVSILTTARDATPFLSDYVASWKRLLPENSQIIYVDDHSSDDGFDRLQGLWSGDDRLVAIRNEGRGRGAALNVAIANAKNDICLIADVDDISTEGRIPNTLQIFENMPDLDYLSFLLFNEKDLFRSPRKSAPLISDVGIEALFGMPAPFPAFAFKKSRFSIPLDETLKGGIDCDWLRKNLAASGLRGYLDQRPMVYYRQHPGQITKNHNPVQKNVRKELIYQEFMRVNGELKDHDRQLIDILVDIRKGTVKQKKEILEFVCRTIDANRTTRIHQHVNLATTLLEATKMVRLIASKNADPFGDVADFEGLRALAKQHIENNEFKQARRTLREALRIRKDLEMQRQLLVASKYGLIRAVARKLWWPKKIERVNDAVYD